MGKKDIRLLVNWWKVFQEQEEKVESIEEPEDDTKENDFQISEDEKELDEVDKEIKELQVSSKINKQLFTVS